MKKNDPVTSTKLIISSRSGEKVKTTQRTGREYRVRYLTCYDLSKPETAYFISLYPDSNGFYPKIHAYTMIELVSESMSPAKVDPKYNKTIDEKPFNQAFWINKYKDLVILGQYSLQKTFHFSLEDCKFNTDYIFHGPTSSKIPAVDIGFEYFSPKLSLLSPQGTITITGVFELRLHAVDGIIGEPTRWETIHIYKEGTIDASKSDLSNLQAYVRSSLSQDRLADLIATIKQILKDGHYISFEEMTQMANKAQVDVSDVSSILETMTFKKSYEQKFFQSLKDLQTKDKKIYYSMNGFVFHINDHLVWEVPETGTATYIFDDQNIIELMAKLEQVKRRSILINEDLASFLKYRRRVIHPDDVEEQRHFDRWLLEVRYS